MSSAIILKLMSLTHAACMGVVYTDAGNIVPNAKHAIPLMKRSYMTETQHHIGLMLWAKTQPILSEYLIHIPNGGYRHLKEAIKLKKMGVKAGVSDLFLAYPNAHYHGLWIELKSEKGKLSPEQKHWLVLMEKVGYASAVSYSIEDTYDILQNYFDLF
jgi:hypothetical protein